MHSGEDAHTYGVPSNHVIFLGSTYLTRVIDTIIIIWPGFNPNSQATNAMSSKKNSTVVIVNSRISILGVNFTGNYKIKKKTVIM